jgi:hypothetical protein
MNVGSQSVAISYDGGVVVLPPQTQSAPISSSSPSSGEYTSGSESSSWFFDEDDVSSADDDSGSEYAPSEDLEDCDAPLLRSRCTRGCRAAVTYRQAQQIRNMHSLSLSDMQDNLKHRILHVMWQGGTPNFSYWSTPQPTVPQTPVGDAADALLDAIYSGYYHITTLDLDEVANLSDLQSPTQPSGQGVPDAPAQPELDYKFDVPFVQANWIDPYGIPPGSYMEHLPVCNVPLDSEDYPFAFHTLANSGLNFLTDYPLSDSPRKGCFEITAILHRNDLWNSSSRETVTIGQPLEWPTRLEKVSTRETFFRPFSYTNVWQPRTELMRATEGAPVSPRAMPPMSPAFGVLFEA